MKAVGQWMRFSDTASCFTVIVRGNDGEKELAKQKILSHSSPTSTWVSEDSDLVFVINVKTEEAYPLYMRLAKDFGDTWKYHAEVPPPAKPHVWVSAGA